MESHMANNARKYNLETISVMTDGWQLRRLPRFYLKFLKASCDDLNFNYLTPLYELHHCVGKRQPFIFCHDESNIVHDYERKCSTTSIWTALS